MYKVITGFLFFAVFTMPVHAAWSGRYALVLITFTQSGSTAPSSPSTLHLSTFTNLNECKDAANDILLLQIPNVPPTNASRIGALQPI